MQSPERKIQTGQNLEVVCFLMSVEIERLRGENDQWRNRYSELERRSTDRSSLDISLRNLTIELNEYKARANTVISENERLKSVIIPLQNEVDLWKRKYSEVDVTTNNRYILLAKENEEWKLRSQKLELSVIEFRSSEGRFREVESKLSLITQEYERLRTIL